MTVYERPFGRYFEDFEAGDVYKHWPGKTITEYDDHLFCMMTMSHHPLHTGAVRQRRAVRKSVGRRSSIARARHVIADVSGGDRQHRSSRCKLPIPRRHDLRRTKVLDKKESQAPDAASRSIA